MAAVIVSIEYAGAPAGEQMLRLLCRELRTQGVRAAAVIKRETPNVSSRTSYPDTPDSSDCSPKTAEPDALKNAPSDKDFIFTAAADGEKLVAYGSSFPLERIIRLCPDTDAVLISGWGEYEFPTVDLARCAPGSGPRPGDEMNLSGTHVGSVGEANEVKMRTGLSGEPNYDDIYVSSGAYALAAKRIIELGISSDPCWLPYARLASGADSPSGGVSLSIDGSKVALLPFVQDIIRQVNLGLISALKDTGCGKRIEIVIEPK